MCNRGGGHMHPVWYFLYGYFLNFCVRAQLGFPIDNVKFFPGFSMVTAIKALEFIAVTKT